VATIPLQAIEASYREYLRVPGFERKKRALAGYVVEASADPATARSRVTSGSVTPPRVAGDR